MPKRLPIGRELGVEVGRRAISLRVADARPSPAAPWQILKFRDRLEHQLRRHRWCRHAPQPYRSSASQRRKSRDTGPQGHRDGSRSPAAGCLRHRGLHENRDAGVTLVARRARRPLARQADQVRRANRRCRSATTGSRCYWFYEWHRRSFLLRGFWTLPQGETQVGLCATQVAENWRIRPPGRRERDSNPHRRFGRRQKTLRRAYEEGST